MDKFVINYKCNNILIGFDNLINYYKNIHNIILDYFENGDIIDCNTTLSCIIANTIFEYVSFDNINIKHDKIGSDSCDKLILNNMSVSKYGFSNQFQLFDEYCWRDKNFKYNQYLACHEDIYQMHEACCMDNLINNIIYNEWVDSTMWIFHHFEFADMDPDAYPACCGHEHPDLSVKFKEWIHSIWKA